MVFDDEELISSVQMRNLLWNNSLNGYKNKHTKIKLWEQVAKEVKSNRKCNLFKILFSLKAAKKQFPSLYKIVYKFKFSFMQFITNYVDNYSNTSKHFKFYLILNNISCVSDFK